LKRRANRILNSAFETAQKTINPGVNELEAYDAIHYTILMDIQEPFILDVTFASGPNTVSRHGPPIGRHLVEGDLFINGSLSNTRDV
jgi:Xaa-Pro aminopeptidase